MTATTTELYQDPKWIRYTEATFSHIGYVLSRGGILVVGAGLAWAGYMSGAADASNRSFYEGCKAASLASICDHAVELGAQLNKVRASMIATRGHGLPVATTTLPGKLDSGAILPAEVYQICGQMRAQVGDGMALHYGCPAEPPSFEPTASSQEYLFPIPALPSPATRIP